MAKRKSKDGRGEKTPVGLDKGERIKASPDSLVAQFEKLPDPRMIGKVSHKLVDIVVICFCGVLAGCNEFTEIELYAKTKEDFLRTFLELRNGIPSHDTLGRVMKLLNPTALQECCIEWILALQRSVRGKTVAIDGKTLRRSFDAKSGLAALHTLNVWCSENGALLAQENVEAKSNEITAIPEVLDRIEVKGATVTIDAMGCQRDIAQKIRDKKAEYMFGLKGNQGRLHDQVRAYFEQQAADSFAEVDYDYFETKENSHGRKQTRACYVAPLPDDEIEAADGWRDLNTIGMIASRTETSKGETTDVRYFISSLPCDAERFARSVRAHWGVENSLHWTLDVVFQEDLSRIRKGHARENMAMLRRFVISLLKQIDPNIALKNKRHMAGWNDDYLLNILTSCSPNFMQ